VPEDAATQPENTSSFSDRLIRWRWFIVAALSAIALWLRVSPRLFLVFQSGFVNFQEIDAWYHIRVAENLVRHFPWRISVDPYLTFGQVPETATAPTYDWFLGLIAWIAGFGSPSPALLYTIAAWYPAVLGALIVVIVFLLGRLVFDWRAALVAAAVIAVLPGHFFRVSSLGFTDHHVMESLLAALFFFLLLSTIQQTGSWWGPCVAGFALAAYLLTFHGAAILAGVVILWAVCDRLRSFWPRDAAALSLRRLFLTLGTALAICLLFRKVLWMNYTIATLAGGVLLIALAELWVQWHRRSPVARPAFLIVVAIAAIASAVAVFKVPYVRHLAKHTAGRLFPGLMGTSGGVQELQSLIISGAHYSIMPSLEQFYGAFLFAIAGLLLLAEVALQKGHPGRTLIVFWSVATCILSAGQLRMTYYFAVCVALLTGYAAVLFARSGRKAAWAVAIALVLFVIAPSVYANLNSDDPAGVPPDWKDALDWLRKSTPEPFGDPDFYYAQYDPRQFGPAYRYPPSAYSILAWWDYGYWIMEIGRRIPLANPTQHNADVAADFFLSQTEEDAAKILRQWHTRYLILDDRLPLWPTDKEELLGDYPHFFEWSPSHNRSDYLVPALDTTPSGSLRLSMFYRPAYFRSTVVRLFVYGGEATPATNTVLLTFRPDSATHPIRTIDTRRNFASLDEALAAEAACKSEGCVLVSDNPMMSCVPIEPLHRFKSVFSSATSVIGYAGAGRKSLQIYQFTGEP